MLSPTVLAGVLRQWLGEWPDKVLFGTDAFDGGVEQGWEQVAWVGIDDGATALAIALTGMMRDGEITRDRAQALARMVMRENAAAVYGLPKMSPSPFCFFRPRRIEIAKRRKASTAKMASDQERVSFPRSNA